MQFIPESTIDQTVEYLETLDNYDALMAELGQSQPAVLAYLLSDNFDLFTEAERDFSLFLSLTIWKSIQHHYPDFPVLTAAQIGKNEESNWEIFDQQRTKVFKEKLNVFFENYEQEDLLAFVEDALEPDDEHLITNEGRDYLFISMKSIIDALNGVDISEKKMEG